MKEKRGDSMKGFKTFPIQIPDSLHADMKLAAEKEKISLYYFIMSAIEEKIKLTNEVK